MIKNKSGFTLLELMMVLFLSLLILGLVMVYFANLLSSVQLQTTVRDLSTTLRQARSLAKIKGEQQGVTIDLDNKEYFLAGHRPQKIPSNFDFKIFDSTLGEIRQGTYQILFTPNWGTENATFLFTYKRKTMTVRLDPVLGALVEK